MDNYKNKYLKYKYKYLELKNQQRGGGDLEPNLFNYQFLDPVIFENNLVSITNCVPQIYGSVEEILGSENKILTTGQINPNYIESEKNLNLLYKPLFKKFNNLLMVNSRGNGNCFINSLYISTFTNNIKLDFNNFYETLMNLGREYYLSIKDTTDLFVYNILIEQFNDPSTPDVRVLSNIYSNLFGCKILIIKDNNKNFKITYAHIFEPIIQNEKTEHIVIIQNGNSHFRALILYNSNIEQRKEFYDVTLQIVKSQLKKSEISIEENLDFPNINNKSIFNFNFDFLQNNSTINPSNYSDSNNNQIILKMQQLYLSLFVDKVFEEFDYKLLINTNPPLCSNNICSENIDKLFKPVFQKFNNLVLINPNPNKYPLITIFYIFTVMSNKQVNIIKIFTDIQNTLFPKYSLEYQKEYKDVFRKKFNILDNANTRIDDPYLESDKLYNETFKNFNKEYIISNINKNSSININNFISAIIYFIEIFFDKNKTTIVRHPGDMALLYSENKDNKIKDMQLDLFFTIYSIYFNCKILVIELRNNYEFKYYIEYEPTESIYYKIGEINSNYQFEEKETDYLIIIRNKTYEPNLSGGFNTSINYQLLTLVDSTIQQRKELYDEMLNIIN